MTEAESRQAIVKGLSSYGHEFWKVLRWATTSDEAEGDREQATTHDDADIISSKIINHDLHTVMLDLDVPAQLVPSSTPGHSHLYIDVTMSWRTYARLLRALADAGVIERGYMHASIARRFTALRLPWIKKDQEVSR